MKNRIEIRRYRRRFLQPLRTAHGVWREREGFLIRITSLEAGSSENRRRHGFGEVAPVPWLGSETVEEAAAFLRGLEGTGLGRGFGDISRLPACRFGIDSAMAALRDESAQLPIRKTAIAALLPAGERALEELPKRLAAGFRTFKWKIGVETAEKEREIFRELRKGAPGEIRFRLDANGGLSREETVKWLEGLDELGAEFLEQPLPPEEFDEMNRLISRYQTPIALDESVGNARQFEEAHARGWKGLFVIKPAIFGAMREGVALLPALRPRLILSSVFETSVGYESLLRWASRWQPEDRAAGIGTGGYLEEDGLFRHPRMPHLIPGLVDLRRIWKEGPM